MAAGIKSLARSLQSKSRGRDTKVTVPKHARVRGEPHMLSYITAEEAALLRSRGGGVSPGGGQMMHLGVPAYIGAGGEGDGGPSPNDGMDGGPSLGAGAPDGGDGDGGPFLDRDTTTSTADTAQKDAEAKAAAETKTRAEARQQSLIDARNIASRNPMQHIAGMGTGYQGPLNTYRPNYYAYGAAPAMQFGESYQAPMSQGGMQNAASRMIAEYGGITPTQADARQGADFLRTGVSPAVFQQALANAPKGFNEVGYLSANPDVAAAMRNGQFQSGYQHYQQFGLNEGRGNPFGFDEGGYLSSNPDVAAALQDGRFSSGFQHYQKYGQDEGRQFAQGGLAALEPYQYYAERLKPR